MAKYYKVGADGNAPAGLSIGDMVVTAGGTYRITGTGNPNSANGYYSTLADGNITTGNFAGTYANGGGYVSGRAGGGSGSAGGAGSYVSGKARGGSSSGGSANGAGSAASPNASAGLNLPGLQSTVQAPGLGYNVQPLDLTGMQYSESGAVQAARDNYQAAQNALAGISMNYTPSAQVQQALGYLNQVQGERPGAWNGGNFLDDVQAIYQKIMDREPFSYDMNSDVLYQQYRDQYVDLGRMAMMDTMGQAAGLTGGYGSSYAQAVGQQQYNAYLQRLNDVLPELYGMALDTYNSQGQDLYNQASLANQMYQNEYGEWADSYNRWLSEYQMAYGMYADERSFDYGTYADQVNLEYNKASSLLGYAAQDYQNERQFDYNDYLNRIDLAQQSYQNQVQAAQYQNELAQQSFQNALSLEQYQNDLAQQNWQNAFAMEQWNTQLQQYQDTLAQQQWENQFAQSQLDYNQQSDRYSSLQKLIATTGYSPSEAELTAAGMTAAEAQSWKSYYDQQQALAAAGSYGSGGGSGGGGGGGGGRSYGGGSGGSSGSVGAEIDGYDTSTQTGLYQAMRAAGITDAGFAAAWIQSNGYATNGTTANAMAADYMNWLANNQRGNAASIQTGPKPYTQADKNQALGLGSEAELRAFCEQLNEKGRDGDSLYTWVMMQWRGGGSSGSSGSYGGNGTGWTKPGGSSLAGTQ